MDNRLVLVKCVTLLYRESLVSNKTENSCDLIRSILETIRLPEVIINYNKEKDILTALKQTVLEMCENSVDFEYDKTMLLQTLKGICDADTTLYDLFIQGIETELSEASLKRTIVNIRKSLHNHFREKKVEEILTKSTNDFRFKRDSIRNVHTWISELCSQLEPFQIGAVGKDPAIVSEVDIGNTNQTAVVFEEIKNMENGTSLLKTGWQEFNSMLQGGFRRGEEVMVGALQHKYKTGFTLSLFAQIAMYNKPMMIDATKKPLLLRISFEDDLTNNFKFLYEYFRNHEKRNSPETYNPEASTDKDVIASYIKEKLQVNGYEVKFLRVNPSDWTYMHVCNKITELEAEGYEIHMLMLDYLAMLPTTGCTVGPAGTDMRDMYRRIRNFCSPRKITVITPHQLSTEAKQLIRDGRQNFVKEVEGKGYLAGCKQLDQELDLELYIHIEKFQGQYYLTIQRGKHRGVPVLEDELKYFALPFPKKGPILEDVGRANSAVRKLGGAPIGSGGEETPFWEFGSTTI